MRRKTETRHNLRLSTGDCRRCYRGIGSTSGRINHNFVIHKILFHTKLISVQTPENQVGFLPSGLCTKDPTLNRRSIKQANLSTLLLDDAFGWSGILKTFNSYIVWYTHVSSTKLMCQYYSKEFIFWLFSFIRKINNKSYFRFLFDLKHTLNF